VISEKIKNMQTILRAMKTNMRPGAMKLQKPSIISTSKHYQKDEIVKYK
jgi:hypothetical protein